MLADKMSSIVKGTFGLVGGVLIVVAVLCIAPFLLVWSVNTLAAAGGSDFYIAHGLFNYFVAVVLLLLVRGGQ